MKRRLETTTALVGSQTITTVSVRDRYRSGPPIRGWGHALVARKYAMYVCVRRGKKKEPLVRWPPI